MKRIRKSYPEPQELADYRTRFINAPTQPGWDTFKKSPERREPVKLRLREDQRGVCAYCENRLAPEDESVEHFVPKSAAHARELDWTNLLLCCAGGERPLPEDSPEAGTRYDPHAPKTCGHAKRATVMPILNPLEIPAFPRLFRFSSETGLMRPDEDGCGAAGVDPTFAEQTISVLGLHAGRLNRARLAVVDTVLNQLASDGIDSAFSKERVWEIARQLIPVTGALPPFFTTIRWVLGAGAEDYLAATGFQG